MNQLVSSGWSHVSVLSCFPPSVGRDIAVAVVKPLGDGLGNPQHHSPLCTDRQVKWTMEVLRYGLTLPLDGDTVQLCVDVYTDWLMALVSPKDSIPPPISREPNMYAQKILRHLCCLFLHRSDQVSPFHQALHRQVLFAVRSLAREGAVMSRDTWEMLLHFLLRINQAMLAPPTAAAGVSDLSAAVLFEVWLLSCSRCYPSRSLWKVFRQMLSSWRHQPVVVDEWSRVVAALTSRLLKGTCVHSSFPQFKVPDEDAALIPADLDQDRIPQTWFRLLHIFGNPVDLSPSEVVGCSQDEASRRDALLPNIFLRVVRGVGSLVDAFLGVRVISQEPAELPKTGLTAGLHFRDRLPSLGVAVTRNPLREHLPSYGVSRPRSGSAPPLPVNILNMPSVPQLFTISPPLNNRRLKPASVTKATSKRAISLSSPNWKSSITPPLLCPAPRPAPSPLRCKVDSLLHLLGSWLFDAALINRDSGLSEKCELGRAEACGMLCRIFTCKRTAEDILPVYLSRFYLVLLQGVQVCDGMSPPVLASVLMNSSHLFCCDLRGVNMLLPAFTAALENVLLNRDLLKFKTFVRPVDLRRASLLVLLSLMPLPLQLASVQSQVWLDRRDDVTAGSFLSMKPRLIGVLIGALQMERDASNTQLILAAMLNLVHDSSLGQNVGGNQQPGGTGWSEETGGQRRARGNGLQSDAAGVLWVQFVRLVTRHLTSHWRNESAICLSALEVLGGLAKVDVQVEESERRRVLSCVCSFIVFQCSRPPPLHSRDLHSIIVAAFFCLNGWLTRHPQMLDNQDCLLEVLETVELGVSGSRSRQEDEWTSKEDKDLNPSSLRVKEAAEATLSCVMQVSGAFPLVGGLLDEDALIGRLASSDSSVKKFRYFVVDDSVILSMMEQKPKTEQAACPSLTLLIRGPSGHHVWTLQLHLESREGRTRPQRTVIPEHRVAAQEDSGIPRGGAQQLFPKHVDQICSVKADRSIPALRETIDDQVQLEYLRSVLKRQRGVEAGPETSGGPVVVTTCRPPPPVSNFQTARLFLSNLGLLTPETLKDPGVCGVPAQLSSLDPSQLGFSEDLRRLDQLPSRNCDSVFVFFMRAGQKNVFEVLSNVESRSGVSSSFLDFLSTLGQPVEAEPQTGGVAREFSAVVGDSGGGVFNGETFVLKFTDALTELTFIVPTTSHVHLLTSLREADLPSDSLSNPQRSSEPTSPEDRKRRRLASESKLFIVWVELLEDIEHFPLSNQLSETETSRASNLQLIFVHPLKTGLYRICFHGNKSSIVIPLVDGSVVSKRSLGFLVVEMIINCCQRRRLDSDSAPQPQVRRKHAINDMILRYRSRRSEPAFYSSLFHDL